MKGAPIRIWRDPTRRDVEDMCRENGGVLLVRPCTTSIGGRRFYNKKDTVVGPINIWIGIAAKGARPDWRGMLKRLGSDWV